MIAPQCLRSQQHLSGLLTGELTESVAADMTQHLEQCEDCRRKLELLAAGNQWWKDARQYLSDDELDIRDDATQPPDGDTRDPIVEIEDLLCGFLQPSTNREMLGCLDAYEIQGVIGCGGMGIVLKGHDSQLNRHVAIKVLAPHYATNSAARRRFAREAQAAAAVVHPHVIAIHGVSANARLPYLVMPYVTGQSLQQCIDEHGPLELRDILRVGLQAAQGLHAAHSQGLVHRDIKPANILLENGVQRVLLTDFGLARAMDDASLTCSGMIAGTPEYMAPEQARGDACDHRGDLFSLGSVLYAMCTGRPPFRAETTMGVLRRICDDQPRDLLEINPDVPVWLAAIIEKLLAKRPADRFQSADEVARLLERCLAHVQHPSSLPLPEAALTLAASRRPARRSWQLRGWPFAVAAGVCGAVALFAWLYPPDQNQQTSVRQHVVTAQPASPEPAEVPVAVDERLPWVDAMESEYQQIEARLWQLQQIPDDSW